MEKLTSLIEKNFLKLTNLKLDVELLITHKTKLTDLTDKISNKLSSVINKLIDLEYWVWILIQVLMNKHSIKYFLIQQSYQH